MNFSVVTCYSHSNFRFRFSFKDNLKFIENKLKQLELGLNSHRAEVGKIRKQIDTIQEKHSDSSGISNGIQNRNSDTAFNDVAIESPFEKDTIQSECSFRTDITSKPDIQV